MAQFIPQISHNFSFSPHNWSESLCMTFFFFEEKKKEAVKVVLIGSFNDCLFTETSTAPAAQAVAPGNSREEEPNSVLERFCQSDQTIMQQHVLDDVVTLCSENCKKSRKQRIWECFTWYIWWFICKHYLTVFTLNIGFMFFDRKTRHTLWKHLKANIPWLIMEVWETSTSGKPVLFQWCTINTHV